MVTRRAFLHGTTVTGLNFLGINPGAATGPIGNKRMSARAAGFRMPLESERHSRSFMPWPARSAIYGSRHALEAVRASIALIAVSIASFEPVVMLARSDQIAAARKSLGPGIQIWPIPTDDLWCRDSGPTFVRSAKGQLAVTDLNFNGWGNRQTHARDGRIAARVARRLGLPVFNNGVVGEAGGAETDGAGTLLAHESSWVNPNRNRQSKAEIERLLIDALGGARMLWAPGVRGGDITDYHIDALARLVKPGQVLIQLPEKADASDPWSVAAFETYNILKQERDANGQRLDIVVLAEPGPNRIRARSAGFVASYVNFYVCNGAVIGAEFGDDKADENAIALLLRLYPGRVVLSLDVDPIGEAGGGIHCSTQQQPA